MHITTPLLSHVTRIPHTPLALTTSFTHSHITHHPPTSHVMHTCHLTRRVRRCRRALAVSLKCAVFPARAGRRAAGGALWPVQNTAAGLSQQLESAMPRDRRTEARGSSGVHSGVHCTLYSVRAGPRNPDPSLNLTLFIEADTATAKESRRKIGQHADKTLHHSQND